MVLWRIDSTGQYQLLQKLAAKKNNAFTLSLSNFVSLGACVPVKYGMRYAGYGHHTSSYNGQNKSLSMVVWAAPNLGTRWCLVAIDWSIARSRHTYYILLILIILIVLTTVILTSEYIVMLAEKY